MPSPSGPRPPFALGSVSLRLYPHPGLATATDVVGTLCRQAGLADARGFDGVMTSEHHGGFGGYLPNPVQLTGWTLDEMSSAWSAPCPTLLPLRPVALLAEDLAWLAARYPGRVGIGVAPGSLDRDFAAVGLDRDAAFGRFRDDLPRLVAMLRGDEDALGAVAGDRALAACADDPVPVLSTAMSPGAVRRAARCGAGVLFDGATRPDHQRELSDVYRVAGGTGPRVLIRRVWLGDLPPGAAEKQAELYRSYASAGAQRRWQDQPIVRSDDPAELAAALAEALAAAGGDALNLRVHLPDMTPDQVDEQIRVIGGEVLPRLRPRLPLA
jgi:alkanesulfonate monooxygenase SsuD/methylene tetrahydromethanopterin reductase-like flavin-dependent oxidoreductase (luciferase family)